VIDRLDFPADRIVTIEGAADPRFHAGPVSDERKRELLGPLGLSKPYIMYTGGIDHRKNVEGTIRAFGLLPPEIRRIHQFAVVCNVDESDRIRLQRLVKSCGLPRESVVLTGFVPDDDLVDLYRCCELSVFPSKYEGFGLPVLEAMSCGAPTIAANASSLPEVVGRRDALFSADSDGEIAAAIAHALSDKDFRSSLRAHALERSRMYSWQRVADRANDAWCDALARKSEHVAVAMSASRPRLAIVTPLLPERSGIADFITELLPPLAEYFRIDLFGCEDADADRYRAMGFDVHPWQTLPATWLNYERGVLYQFGNSRFHVHMLALLQVCPGAVFLHDAYLSGLMAYMELGPPRIHGFFGNMLAYSHSAGAVARYRSKGFEDAIESNPMSRWVADHASGVIVTSRHARNLLLGGGEIDGVRCRVVQHQRSVRATTSSDRARARELLGIPLSTVLVCSLGHVHTRKQSVELVDAWSSRRIHASARLVFVGDAGGDYGDTLGRAITDSARSAEIDVTGYVSEETFQLYIQAADIVVQLRKGSRGEASGAALYAMARGVPLVASRHGSLAEIPDHACVHVDDPLDTAQLADVLADLAANPDKRTAVGRRGQDWIREACDPKSVARQIACAVASFNDPAIVHRRANLKAKAMSFCNTIASPMQGEWLNDVEAGADSAEPHHPNADLAQTLSEALRGVVAAPSSQMARKPRFQMPAAGETLTLLVDDPRFLTACGARSGALLETTGSAGVLLYGPYIGAAPGRYRVRVYGNRRAGVDTTVARLEIVSSAGRHVLASCEIAGGTTAREGSVIARLDFATDEQVEDLEVRIHVSSEVDMAVESVDLVTLGV
jgi:glycosyltransferase involved in cell wall biosynthesis